MGTRHNGPMGERVRIKVCCIASVEEARVAVDAGVDAIGLVGRMPSGPGPIADALIAEVQRAVPPPVMPFLLTSETEGAAIAAHVVRTGVPTVQIVDDEVTAGARREVRAAAAWVRIVQVVHVRDGASVARALACAEGADALLLDSGNPGAAVRELGGTGRVHDWAVSREIVARSPVPVFLAGGLKPGNVGEAIAAVGPYGVDVCSGVRTQGRLVAARVRAFVDAVRGV